MAGAWVRAVSHQHGIIAVDGEKAGDGVDLAGVDVIDALGNPLGLLGVIHGTDVWPQLRHAGNVGGVGIEGQGDLPRRCQTEGRAPGTEGSAGCAQRGQAVHAVGIAGNVHTDLKAVG